MCKFNVARITKAHKANQKNMKSLNLMNNAIINMEKKIDLKR